MITRIFLVKFLAIDFIDSTSIDSFYKTTYRFCQLCILSLTNPGIYEKHYKLPIQKLQFTGEPR